MPDAASIKGMMGAKKMDAENSARCQEPTAPRMLLRSGFLSQKETQTRSEASQALLPTRGTDRLVGRSSLRSGGKLEFCSPLLLLKLLAITHVGS